LSNHVESIDVANIIGESYNHELECIEIYILEFMGSSDFSENLCASLNNLHVEESMGFTIDTWLYHRPVLFDTCGRDTSVKWMHDQYFVMFLTCTCLDYLIDKITLQISLHSASKRGFYWTTLSRHKFYWDDDVHMLYKGVFIPIRLNWVK